MYSMMRATTRWVHSPLHRALKVRRRRACRPVPRRRSQFREEPQSPRRSSTKHAPTCAADACQYSWLTVSPVDQQTDDDLRIDPTLFRITDLAEGVFGLSLGIQGRHVAQRKAQPTAIGGIREAL